MQNFTFLDLLAHPLFWFFVLIGILFALWLVHKRYSLPFGDSGNELDGDSVPGSGSGSGAPPQSLLVSYGGGAIAGGLLGGLFFFLVLLLTSGGGSGAAGALSTLPPATITQVVTPTLTITPTMLPTRARPTATAVPVRVTPTTQVRATPTKSPPLTITPKATLPVTPTATATAVMQLPAQFDITLTGAGETACGYPDFTYDYSAAVSDGTLSLTQIVNGIVTTGPYDPATGAFTTTMGGLPGTEIYDGKISLVSGSITIQGTYTYVNDPNQACEGLWQIAGTTTP